MKKLCLFLASVMVCGGLFGCDSESMDTSTTDVSEKTCKKDCAVQGGRTQACFVISGAEVCKEVCLGDKEGENASACWKDASQGPEASDFSIKDKCAKDELGKLYSVTYESTICPKGCESGECKTDQEPTCSKNCNIAGGRLQTCVRIDGEESCKDVCRGSKEVDAIEGVNEPFCYRNTSLGPDAVDVAMTDTCARDDLGTLYVVSSQPETCTNGCEGGECQAVPIQTGCSKSCQTAGGSPKVCVRIEGVDSCKDTCKGPEGATLVAGPNEPFCFRYASSGPTAHYLSMATTCAEDDLGTLYAVDTQSQSCDTTEHGVCLRGACMSMAEACTQLRCEGMIGGRAKSCVSIFGQAQCKDQCIGTKEGENDASCINNASTGNVMSIVDTCAKDDMDTLYSVSSVTNRCAASCKNGVCDDTL